MEEMEFSICKKNFSRRKWNDVEIFPFTHFFLNQSLDRAQKNDITLCTSSVIPAYQLDITVQVV